MTARPVLEEIAVTVGQYRKGIVAALGVAAAIVQALYPADVPRWGVVITAAAAAAAVIWVRNDPKPASTSSASSPFGAITTVHFTAAPAPSVAAAAPADTTAPHTAEWGPGHACSDGGAPHSPPCICVCGVAAAPSSPNG